MRRLYLNRPSSVAWGAGTSPPVDIMKCYARFGRFVEGADQPMESQAESGLRARLEFASQVLAALVLMIGGLVLEHRYSNRRLLILGGRQPSDMAESALPSGCLRGRKMAVWRLLYRCSRARYCSTTCAHEARRKPPRTCEHCHEEFGTNYGDARTQYCSWACYVAARR